MHDLYCRKNVDAQDNNYKVLEWIYRRNHAYSIVEQPELISLLKFTPLSRSAFTDISERLFDIDFLI